MRENLFFRGRGGTTPIFTLIVLVDGCGQQIIPLLSLKEHSLADLIPVVELVTRVQCRLLVQSRSRSRAEDFGEKTSSE